MCFRPLFAKLAYSLPAWFGLCTAADWARFDSFLRRCVKLCYSSISNPPSVSSMLGDAEHSLFQKIISNKHHVLQPYLTNRADVHYKLRNQNHNKTLIPKTVDLTDRLFDSLSVLWHCWLGGRKGIRPVKILSDGVLVWLSVWGEVQICVWPSWCHCHLSLASVKSRLVLPFWYQLTWVVPDKIQRAVNSCSSSHSIIAVSDVIRSLFFCYFYYHVYIKLQLSTWLTNENDDDDDDDDGG